MPFRLLTLLFVTIFCPLHAPAAGRVEAGSEKGIDHRTADTRFVRLNDGGQPITTPATVPRWPCVLDRDSRLIWEVKTLRPGLHQRDRTFSWYQTNPQHNGGDRGEPGTVNCKSTPCNTQALVQAVNHEGWCGAHDWRLPNREELRTLVDYRIAYPGPTLDIHYFPQTVAQFYWSASANASDAREAWGIGFAFGFDYAYFKSNRVHVRLVRHAPVNKGGMR